MRFLRAGAKSLRKKQRKCYKKVSKKIGAAATIFFGSFLDTKKELGCGAKPHCYNK